jgi:eukaryotic-like serine/threonine-protein kinase
MSGLFTKIKALLPNENDTSEHRYFKTVIFLALGTIVLMLLAGFVTFMVSIRGQEQTMVPNVVGNELENALVALQEKELYPHIQLRYSSTPADKGTILEQDPNPGAIVKAKSKILLRVSKGSIIEQVDNYVGWNIDDLEIHLKSLVSIHGPLLSIKEPVQRVFNDQPSGTIISQKPEPGTEISAETSLELIVSRGPQTGTITVLDYQDMPYMDAIESLIRQQINFTVSARDADEDEMDGVVVSQNPAPESDVPAGSLHQLTISRPEDIPEDYVFGVLEKSLPNYAIPATITIDAVRPDGERETLFELKHQGGLLSIPYLEPENTVLLVLIEGTEKIRFTVKKER